HVTGSGHRQSDREMPLPTNVPRPQSGSPDLSPVLMLAARRLRMSQMRSSFFESGIVIRVVSSAFIMRSQADQDRERIILKCHEPLALTSSAPRSPVTRRRAGRSRPESPSYTSALGARPLHLSAPPLSDLHGSIA